jgi:hypothetical protein
MLIFIKFKSKKLIFLMELRVFNCRCALKKNGCRVFTSPLQPIILPYFGFKKLSDDPNIAKRI